MSRLNLNVSKPRILKRYPVVLIEDSEPKFAYGLLEEFTELHVLDAITNTTIKDAVVKEKSTKIGNPLAKILPYFTKGKDDLNSRDNDIRRSLLQSFQNRSAPRVYRVYPLPDFRSFDQLNAHDVVLRCPCHVLIPRSCLPKGAKPNGTMCKFLI